MSFLEKFTINNLEKNLQKEFLIFASLFLVAFESFAGNLAEKKEMTPDNVKAVYAKFNEYKKNHPDTVYAKVGAFDVSMYSVGNGYEFDVTQNEDKETSVDNGKTITTQHIKKTFKYVDLTGDGTVDNVSTSSSSSTSTISNNMKAPSTVKISDNKSVITPSFQAAASVMDHTLNNNVK